MERKKERNRVVGRERGMREYVTLVIGFVTGCDASYEMQGPSFVSEPPSRVEFTNVNGGRVDCTVRGNPAPTVDWLAADGGSITSIPGIRHVLGNGTIHFPGFEAEVFRQDVHWAIYKCSAVNSVGAIVSRDVTVRAGTQKFLPRYPIPHYPVLSSSRAALFVSFVGERERGRRDRFPFDGKILRSIIRARSLRYGDIRLPSSLWFVRGLPSNGA